MKAADVTLTDYGLALESAAFAYLVHRRQPAGSIRPWVLMFFAGTSTATLCGGTVHGFFDRPESRGHRIFWPASLLATGVAALAGWAIALRLCLDPPRARRLTTVATAEFVAYSTVVLVVNQGFVVAALNYLPPTLFLGLVFGRLYASLRRWQLLAGAGALALSLAATGVQRKKVALHPRYFDHNALFHLLEGGSLFMLYRTFGWLLSRHIDETSVQGIRGGPRP